MRNHEYSPPREGRVPAPIIAVAVVLSIVIVGLVIWWVNAAGEALS